MTSRPRSTARSRTWDDRDRRATLLNLAFGLTIVAALLLLLIAWGASWYNDHLSAAGTVNGQTITKDAWGKQVAINEFRADYQKRRIRTLLAAGQISAADAIRAVRRKPARAASSASDTKTGAASAYRYST